MAEKIRALLERAKGRDVFDLWFLLSKKVAMDRELVAKKIGRKTFLPELRRKIANFPDKILKLDLDQFLPAPMRKIADLKQRLEVLLLANEVVTSMRGSRRSQINLVREMPSLVSQREGPSNRVEVLPGKSPYTLTQS